MNYTIIAIQCKPISFQKTHHNHYKCCSSLTVFFRTSNLPYISHLKCLKHKNQGLVTYSTGWSTGSKGNFQEKEAGHPSILHNTDATMHLKFHSKNNKTETTSFVEKNTVFPRNFPPQTERERERHANTQKDLSKLSACHWLPFRSQLHKSIVFVREIIAKAPKSHCVCKSRC